MSPARRELAGAVLACLLGSVLVLLSLVRDWGSVAVAGTALLPARELGVSGGELLPGVRALAVVGLAGVVGLAATRGRGRGAVGGLLGLVGVVVLVETVRAVADLPARVRRVEAVREVGSAASVDGSAWPVLALAGALLLVAAGALVAVRGRRWSALSARYDAPAGPRAPQAVEQPADKALWDELDRGEDPTAG